MPVAGASGGAPGNGSACTMSPGRVRGPPQAVTAIRMIRQKRRIMVAPRFDPNLKPRADRSVKDTVACSTNHAADQPSRRQGNQNRNYRPLLHLVRRGAGSGRAPASDTSPKVRFAEAAAAAIAGVTGSAAREATSCRSRAIRAFAVSDVPELCLAAATMVQSVVGGHGRRRVHPDDRNRPRCNQADTKRRGNTEQRRAPGAGGDALDLRFHGSRRVDQRRDDGLINQKLRRRRRRRPLQQIVSR